MPKKQHSGRAKSLRTRRTSSKTSKAKDEMKELKIPPFARQERNETIKELIPRERNQVGGRDKEFRKFLCDQYRLYCPDMKCEYKRVPDDVMEECVDWIYTFKGVNKKTDDCLVVDRRFDLPEGRSWVDQRRSKKIIPLFISWLDTIVDAAREMQARHTSLPRDLDLIIVEKLLTTSYHPQSSQSNQTLLVCQQSLHTARMRLRLKDFDIVVPDNKKLLSKFIQHLRQKVDNRGLGLSAGCHGGFDVVSDSSDSETDRGSVDDQAAVIAQKDAELQDLKNKYLEAKSRIGWLESQCSHLHQRLAAYQQQTSMMFTFPNWQSSMLNLGTRMTAPPAFSDQYSASSSPLLSATPSDASFSPSDFPPDIEGDRCFGEQLDAEDFAMMDVDKVPLRLPSPDVGKFFNNERLGY